uniref:Uncharacterized protein n=1 Tax=Desertifilum tharense IPPAS B-1220 TaxID=1781255 RepID=A0A1E5QDM2_9CYAN|nr:hypothetical protein BH720_23525 [Desertifilum tharense IPPAS B-1220]
MGKRGVGGKECKVPSSEFRVGRRGWGKGVQSSEFRVPSGKKRMGGWGDGRMGGRKVNWLYLLAILPLGVQAMEQGSWELGVGGWGRRGWEGWGMGGELAIVLDIYSQYCHSACKLWNKRTPFPTQHAVARKLAREHG